MQYVQYGLGIYLSLAANGVRNIGSKNSKARRPDGSLNERNEDPLKVATRLSFDS